MRSREAILSGGIVNQNDQTPPSSFCTPQLQEFGSRDSEKNETVQTRADFDVWNDRRVAPIGHIEGDFFFVRVTPNQVTTTNKRAGSYKGSQKKQQKILVPNHRETMRNFAELFSIKYLKPHLRFRNLGFKMKPVIESEPFQNSCKPTILI